VIGSPFWPVEDQVFTEPVTVEPKRIELPHLPSRITSPSNGSKGCIFSFSTNVSPKKISVD